MQPSAGQLKVEHVP